MEIAERLFNWFVASTLMASVAAVVVLAIQHLFRRRIHARLRHALWLIVLLRLMLPVLPQSPVSLFNAVPAWTDIKNAVFGFSYQWNKSDEITEHSQIKNTYQPYYTTNGTEKNTVLQPTLTMKDTDEHNAGIKRESHPAIRVLAVVWLTSASVLLGYNLIYWLQFQRKQKHLRPVDHVSTLKILEECRGLFSIKRPVGIYVDPAAQSPYITGVFRPAVFMPKSLFSESVPGQLLKHVIAHELAHYKRKDIIWNIVSGIVFAVHWMNPFVWFMLRQMKADRELACDACVLEVLGEDEAVPYGMTMIGFLRRYAVGRSQAYLLYFKGSNGQREMKRRIQMIQSFKKGSYKFSIMAVILVLLMGTATLTDARASEAKSSDWVHAEDGGNEMLFPNEKFRVYDNLEKGAKVAPFKFKVPSLLPEEYGFSDMSIQFDDSPPRVKLYYVKDKINKTSGNFSIRIEPGADLKKQYNQIRGIELDGADQADDGKVIEKQPLALTGIKEGYKITIRMTDWKGQPERYYYIWKDQDISYELSSYILSSNQMEQLIDSMKLPDAKLNQLHANNDYHGKVLNALYDTEDIRRAQELIGFKAAFPRELPGDFVASSSYVSRKANFNYVENDEDSMRMLLSVGYSQDDHNRNDKANSGIQGISFKQMLNGNMYQEMKKNGQVSFEIMNGERNIIKLTALTLHGKEVLRTEPYNLDGKPKNPEDLSLVSYFWFDGEVCYQAVFQGQGQVPEEQKIVKYLMTLDR